MSPKMKIFLFSDQTTNYHNNLLEKLRQNNNPVLTSFLERVTAGLRVEIAQQTGLVRKAIPDFVNLVDLVEWSAESNVSNPIIESVICTTCQIACLIR